MIYAVKSFKLVMIRKHVDVSKLHFSGGYRGGSGGSLEPPLELNYFIFMGNFRKNEAKLRKRTPFLNLNPLSRNPGSASVLRNTYAKNFPKCSIHFNKMQLIYQHQKPIKYIQLLPIKLRVFNFKLYRIIQCHFQESLYCILV